MNARKAKQLSTKHSKLSIFGKWYIRWQINTLIKETTKAGEFSRTILFDSKGKEYAIEWLNRNGYIITVQYTDSVGDMSVRVKW